MLHVPIVASNQVPSVQLTCLADPAELQALLGSECRRHRGNLCEWLFFFTFRFRLELVPSHQEAAVSWLNAESKLFLCLVVHARFAL